MKTSNIPDLQFNKNSSTFSSITKAIIQRLIRFLTSGKEVQVWHRKDRYGHIYWQAYDPVTERKISLGSEAEMRIWIEQHYYQ